MNQLVPLVEFSFDSPRGQYTAATANPGFAYVAVTWQIAAEAIIPLNRAGGSGAGFRAQLLFFLDDLLPSLFGKPLLATSLIEVKSPGTDALLRPGRKRTGAHEDACQIIGNLLSCTA